MIGAGNSNLAHLFAGGGRPKGQRVAAFGARARRGRTRLVLRSMGLGISIMLLGTSPSSSGVLTENDVKRVEAIKPLFQSLMVDLVETSRRPDISGGDADCIKSTIRELTQISDELSSYEYLITIEKEMTDFGENNPIRGIVKFAVEKSNTILTSERKRLAQLSDRCANLPLSFGKTQQTLRVIDTTTSILDSIHQRL